MIETLSEEDEAKVLAELHTAVDRLQERGIPLIARKWGVRVEGEVEGEIEESETLYAHVRVVVQPEGCCAMAAALLDQELDLDWDAGLGADPNDEFEPEWEAANVLGVPRDWVSGFELGFDGRQDVFDSQRSLYCLEDETILVRGYEAGKAFREQYRPLDLDTVAEALCSTT